MILENAAVSCRAAFLEGPAYLIYKFEKSGRKSITPQGTKAFLFPRALFTCSRRSRKIRFINFFIHTHTEAFYFSMLFPIIPKPERKRLQPPASLSFSTGYDFIDRMG